ncbi:MAG: O-antigen polymerase [Candidatus Brocadiales bacterium]
MREAHYYKKKFEPFSKDSATVKYNLQKGNLLTAAVILLLLSLVVVSLNVFHPDSISFRLGLMLLTFFFQLFTMLRIKRLYTFKQLNPYLIHPAFYINLSVILYCFLPLTFYLFFEELWYTSLITKDPRNISLPLAIFCASVIILNVLFITIDRGMRSYLRKTEEFYQIINVLRRGLPILVVCYALSWLMRILSIVLTGHYYGYLPEWEMEGIRRSYPLLVPSYDLFIFVLYFPVMFTLWILCHTAFKSNKKYKLVLTIFTILDIMFYLPVGTKQCVLQTVLAVLFSGLMVKQKISKKAIVFLIVFFLLYPMYGQYRTHGVAASLDEAKMTQARRFSEERSYPLMVVEAMAHRGFALDDYFYLSQIIQEDFLHGYTYTSVIGGLLPSYLLPLPEYLQDKSVWEMYEKMGLPQAHTLPAGTMWGELYINFGYPGVLVGVPLIGMFCLFMFRILLRRWKFNRFMICCCFLPWFLLLIHGSLSGLITILIRVTVFLFILNSIITIVGRRRQKKGLS